MTTSADITPTEKGGQDLFVEAVDETSKSSSHLEYYRSKWEDLDRVHTIKIFWKASLVCFAAAFSAATDGYQVTLAGNIIANQGFIKQFATTVDKDGTPILAAKVMSIWGNLGSLGQWCGMNAAPFIADRFGRRAVMFSYWLMLAISVTLECTAKSWGVWTVAKFFSLVGIGAMQAMLQMYITEMSPTNHVRGTMLACYNLWWALGQFFGPLALKIMNDNEPLVWRTPIYTQWAQIGIMFIVYCCIPESPWWLCIKGRHDDAIKVLRRLNGNVDGYNVEEEYSILRATVVLEQKLATEHKQNKYIAILQGVDGWRTICTAWTLVVQGTIGISLIYSYVTYFFILAGQTDPFKTTCITSALGVAGVLFIMWGMDKIGRRVIVLTSYWLCWLCLLFIGALSMLKNQSAAVKNGYVALACLWSLGMDISGGVAWAYVGEIPSSQLRSRTAGFGASLATAINFVWGTTTPYMINVAQWNWGLKSCFFFAGVSFFPCLATYFVIPETRGRSPAELDELFEKKIRPWRMASYVTDVEKSRAAHLGANELQHA